MRSAITFLKKANKALQVVHVIKIYFTSNYLSRAVGQNLRTRYRLVSHNVFPALFVQVHVGFYLPKPRGMLGEHEKSL